MVRLSLWHDWNPIGINDVSPADDEYDSYVGGVCSLLLSGADAAKLRRYDTSFARNLLQLSLACLASVGEKGAFNSGGDAGLSCGDCAVVCLSQTRAIPSEKIKVAARLFK